MSHQRVVVSVVAGVLVLIAQVVAAQTKTFVTPWGHPDLQGRDHELQEKKKK